MPTSPAPTKRPETSGTRTHVVRKGETLYSISRRYGTNIETVALANRLSDPTQISIGQSLVVPNRDPRVQLRASNDHIWTRIDPRGHSAKTNLSWPLQGKLSSGYGMRSGAHHDGIDIRASEGSLVRAADSGRVIHADGSLKGYGKMIIIKHNGSLSSVYAHNRRIRVQVGQFVAKGDVIAEVGRTGRASAPHLHFEVRRDGRAVDPLQYLP